MNFPAFDPEHWPPALPAHFNMAAYCLARASRDQPHHPALIIHANLSDPEPAETWTFAGLEDAVLRAAGALQDRALQHGIPPGARVLIRLDNTSAYAILYFAVIAAGYVAVAASSQLTAPEADFLLSDSGASFVALAGGLPKGNIPPATVVLEEDDVNAMIRHPRRADYAHTGPHDPAYLIYTSGTTARPKGVVHAHRVALGRSPTYQGWYGIQPSDRMLHAGAFNWTYTLGTGLIDPWANGVTSIVYTGNKTPDVWVPLIKKTGATLFAAVPSLFRQILKYAGPGPVDVGSLRHGLIAGEGPPPGLYEDWMQRTGTCLYEALGMSEISTYISTGPNTPRKPGTTGKPQSGRRVAVLPISEGTTPVEPGKEGLLAVHRSDPGLMLGYWNRPEEQNEVMRGDWFTGGDIGVMDTDGYVTHLGRANDIMKALGYRVAPLEVETVLAQHPSVADVACAEVRVRSDVSVIGAFVVLKPGFAADRDGIMTFAAERLARYKCPREVAFVTSLPRTANGKVRRSELQGLLDSGREAATI
ncbi:MAG: AMP-binding protein [Hyphomicrobium sp.]